MGADGHALDKREVSAPLVMKRRASLYLPDHRVVFPRPRAVPSAADHMTSIYVPAPTAGTPLDNKPTHTN
jgi:hypothetical protein